MKKTGANQSELSTPFVPHSVDSPLRSGKEMNQPERSSIFSVAAIVIPLVIVGVGIIFSFSEEIHTDDWFGLARIFKSLFSILLGAITSILLAVIAYMRNEENKWISTLAAVPSLLILLAAGAFMVLGAN